MLVVFFVLGLFLGSKHYAPIKKKYFVEEQSKLFLKGNSNVNSFTCDCPERFPARVVEADNNSGVMRFRNAGIRLTVENFNCRNPKIDNDLRKALRASEYPHIEVALLETRHDPRQAEANPNGWWDVSAKVNITIAGQTREHVINAKAKKSGQGGLQLKSEKVLKMSQFGVEPPQAMFGLIKVEDEITICFDISLRSEDVL